MPQGISTGTQASEPQGVVQEYGGKGKLVVDKIEVRHVKEVIKVPEIQIEHQKTTKYIVHEEPTINYVTQEKPTVKYEAREEPTTKYVITEEPTIKYIPREVEVEKPVLVDKPYERPVIREKEYTIATYNDLEAIRELIDLAPKLLKELNALRKYRIVEEVVKVPKIQYVPTTIKRIQNTGELIDDNEVK